MKTRIRKLKTDEYVAEVWSWYYLIPSWCVISQFGQVMWSGPEAIAEYGVCATENVAAARIERYKKRQEKLSQYE